MSDDGTDKIEYFYNTRTKMVEKGRQSSWEHLMGPYDTPDEAAAALAKAAERNEAWADDDADWQGDED